MRQHNYDYDAFISHAVEDKIPIANELCAKLERAGLRIWYSGKELGIGDSIEKTIENGLHRSRYGIVILSPTYLAKNWTIREFYTLLAKEIQEHKVILPVLYNITLDDLKKKDLLMADRFAVHADRGIDHVVERLVHEIRKSKVRRPRVAWFSRIWLVLILSLLANVALVVRNMLPATDDDRLSGNLPAVMSGQVMHADLFDQVEGIFSQLNTCTCNHPRKSSVHSPMQKAHMVRGESGDLQLINQEPVRSNRSASGHVRGKKMTMALVFQIETPPDPVETEVDATEELVQTIADAEPRHFKRVSNGSEDAKSAGFSCFHASNTGE